MQETEAVKTNSISVEVSDEQIERAAALIRAGRLVAFPTETVYGLGANALDVTAVKRIFEAKGRPSTSPLIVHVSTADMARREVVADWPAAAHALSDRYWPGPLTLVLPKRITIPDEVTAGLPTVGVRIPAHDVAARLLEAANVPIAAPSANRFTQLSPTSAQHVRSSLGSAVDLILDGGPTTVGIESTVLSLAGPEPVLLRPGMVSIGELESVIGPIQRLSAINPDGPHVSPGLHIRHYSPKTPLRIGGRPTGHDVWLYRENSDANAGRQVRLPYAAADYANVLYKTLHDLDRENWRAICIEAVPSTPEWEGIRDRLRRAEE